MQKKISFDLDGTLADLYGVSGWLEMLENHDPAPYKLAKPLLNMSSLARLLHKAQRLGYEIAIVSWLSKGGNAKYNQEVTEVKAEWLQSHLPSVTWDEIHIVTYGTPKHEITSGILFDDEERNRNAWGEGAYEPNEILEFLRGL